MVQLIASLLLLFQRLIFSSLLALIVETHFCCSKESSVLSVYLADDF